MKLQHEILFGIIALTLIGFAYLFSQSYIDNKRIEALQTSIEQASSKGIDPIAVRCAYAKADDNICIVYTATFKRN